MHTHFRQLQTTALIITGLLLCSHLQAQEQAKEPAPCSLSDADKEGLCGHALAQIQLIDAGLTTPALSNMNGVESQDDTDITHCFLDFEVFFATASIAGSVTFDVTSRKNGLAQMPLDFVSSMVVDSVTVNGVTAAYTRPTDQVLIELGATYNPGDTFTLQVTFHGRPKNRTDWFGFNFFSSGFAASFGQPFYARNWWPCKDNVVSNTDKFTLDIHVTVPETMTAVCNGALQGVDVLPNARKKFRWHESYPIATYLVSFAASNYQKTTYYYNHSGGAMPVEFYSLGWIDAYHMTNVVQALGTFSDPGVYGTYPFISEKYGMVAFQWRGAMEHQTITSSGNMTSDNLNVHELAHQWWGDAVTCKTWHDIWLHEGFARYSEALFREKRPGGNSANYLAYLNAYKPSISGMGTVYRYDISTSDAIFDTEYTYNKGAWVVHMLRNVMGDAAFFSALTSFQTTLKGGCADTQDFRAFCEAAYGADLGWFFDEWVYNPGMPYYRLAWAQEKVDGQYWLLLSVEQYQATIVSGFPVSMRMPIDVEYTTPSGRHTHRAWTGMTTSSGNTLTELFREPIDGKIGWVKLDPTTAILCGEVTQGTYPSVVGNGADLDRDNDVDRTDLDMFEICMTGPGPTTVTRACASVDFDEDRDVDQSDFGLFQVCLGEPGVVPPSLACLGL